MAASAAEAAGPPAAHRACAIAKGRPGDGSPAARALAWCSTAGLVANAATLGGRGRFFLPGPWLPACAGDVAGHGEFPEADVTRDVPGANGATGAAGTAGAPRHGNAVTAVVPARNELDVLQVSLPALLGQDYPGPWRVVLVDDASSDGTGELARSIASQAPAGVSCEVVTAAPAPAGWAGKVWALAEGLAHGDPDGWVLFTDADVVLAPDVVARLVALAGSEQRDLVSVMARLRCETGWEKLLVPAFVYFFALLYPFGWVASGRATAAAGGCLLVRADVLAASGGLAGIASAVIDDVSLARQVRRHGGRLWLGFADDVRSIRPYPRLADLWQMVARSAYTELDHSPVRLAGALAGLSLLYATPPAGIAGGLLGLARGRRRAGAQAMLCGAAAWGLLSASYLPTVRQHGLGRRWAATLPAAGMLYAAMTCSSALAHHSGPGVAWKGRAVR